MKKISVLIFILITLNIYSDSIKIINWKTERGLFIYK